MKFLKIVLSLALVLLLAIMLKSYDKPVRAQTQSRLPFVSSTVAESCHVFATRPVNLYSYLVSNAATAGWIMVFDAAAAPADGTVSPTLPAQNVASNGTGQLSTFQPVAFGTGLVICYSTTGPFSKTASATAAIGAQFQ